MSQNVTVKNNQTPKPQSTIPAQTMPAPISRSKAQDFRDTTIALNETAQTAFNIYGGFKDREDRRLNSILDRQAPRFEKAADFIDTAVSEGKLSSMEASAAYSRLAEAQGREARETMRALKDGAIKDSKAGRNWLWGIGGLLAGGGVLAWGLSRNG